MNAMEKYYAGKISSTRAHYERGIESGYPECCVINYIRLLGAKCSPAITMDTIFGRDANGPSGYVKCSVCRGLNKIKLDEDELIDSYLYDDVNYTAHVEEINNHKILVRKLRTVPVLNNLHKLDTTTMTTH